MRFRLMGKWWSIHFKPRSKPSDDMGECSGRGCCDKKRRITVYTHPKDTEQEELDTTVHELLHAVAWDHSEEWVASSAKVIADVLYRLGWRKQDEAAS